MIGFKEKQGDGGDLRISVRGMYIRNSADINEIGQMALVVHEAHAHNQTSQDTESQWG